MQTKPVYVSTCDFSLFGARSDSLRARFSQSALPDSEYQFTLTVSGSGGRASRATAVYTVIPTGGAIVAVSATNSARINPTDKVRLVGIVEFHMQGNATWIVDESSLDLTVVALTPLSFALTPSSAAEVASKPAVSLASLNLVLAEHALTERMTYTFTLVCTLDNGVTTQSAITLTTNGPPLIGQFAVQPSWGTALKTKFMFLASNWVDEDLPLSYQYGFISASGDTMVLQTKSEISYGTMVLPAGDGQKNHSLQCSVQVFDMMNANSRAETAVNVKELKLSSKDLQSLVTGELATAMKSVEGAKKAIATMSSVVNSVDCRSSPNCTNLNRQPCLDVVNTCGACVSDRFIGEYGSSNDPCSLVQERKQNSNSGSGTGGVTQSSSRSSCEVDSDCDPLQICRSKLCVPRPKACLNDCSGHGSCQYESPDSGRIVERCDAGDLSCVAVCVCVGAFGGAACQLTAEEIQAKQSMRVQLLQGLLQVSVADDVTPESLVSWTSSLTALTGSAEELNAGAVDTAVTVVSTILTHAQDMRLPHTHFTNMLKSIDIVCKASARGQDQDYSAGRSSNSSTAARASQRQRQLAAMNRAKLRFHAKDAISGARPNGQSAVAPEVLRARGSEVRYTDTAAMTRSLLQSFSAVVTSDMVPGERPVNTIQSQFRMTSLVTDRNALLANTTFDVPKTNAEVAAGALTSSVTFSELKSESNADLTLFSTTDVLHVNTIILNAKLFNNDYITANSVVLQVGTGLAGANRKLQEVGTETGSNLTYLII